MRMKDKNGNEYDLKILIDPGGLRFSWTNESVPCSHCGHESSPIWHLSSGSFIIPYWLLDFIGSSSFNKEGLKNG